MTTLFTNGNLVDVIGQTVLTGGSILVENGMIKEVGTLSLIHILWDHAYAKGLCKCQRHLLRQPYGPKQIAHSLSLIHI